MKRIFIISPVTLLTYEDKQKLLAYTQELENNGYYVHLPFRDTDQKAVVEEIMHQNFVGIATADEVHVAWLSDSKGSHLDLGMAYALRKPIVLVPGFDVIPTEGKSFTNFLLYLSGQKNEKLE